ncbi:acyltransferase family protein [Schaalia sp. lx-100]|uniref:acyltransferase family protein n=1 Tax=Schaalia sp. lx-100 TaxID=2899081 RepID=UPI001E339266|nr:acyltransferase family protein [Schaalia sp. lx-100]MCD4557366.1 acyltransferase [Schaalia sp. lx-100]
MAPPHTHVDRIFGLDGLRACAVIAVLVYHVIPTKAPGGFVGVDLFFVISGFLITYLLLKEKKHTGRIDFAGFYLRRIRRLLPAAFLVITCAGLLATCIGGDITVGALRSMISVFTLSANWVMLISGSDYFAHTQTGLFDHFWSLAIEEQFYLIWPFILFFLVKRRPNTQLFIVSILAALSASSALFLEKYGVSSQAYLATPSHSTGLLLGSLLSIGYFHYAPKRNLTTSFFSCISLILGILGFAFSLTTSLTLHAGHQMLVTLFGSVSGLFLILGCLLAPSWIPRVIDIAPLRWIGERSYGLYLWHLPFIVIADATYSAIPGFTRFYGRICAIICVLCATVLSYRYVEQPIRKKGFTAFFSHSLRARLSAGMGLLLVAVATILFYIAPESTSVERMLTSAQSCNSCEGDSQSQEQESEPSTENSSVTMGQPPVNEPVEVPHLPELQDKTQSEPEKPLIPDDYQNASIYAVGDSVMLASISALYETFPHITVDALTSRQLVDGPALVTDFLSAHPETQIVIVGLGVNGVGDAQTLREVVEACAQRTVVIMSVSAPVAWEERVNSEIRQVVSEFPNALLADWQSAAIAHPEQIAADGIHPSPAGGQYYAQAIIDALEAYKNNS